MKCPKYQFEYCEDSKFNLHGFKQVLERYDYALGFSKINFYFEERKKQNYG